MRNITATSALQLAWPLQVDERGRYVAAARPDHVEQMLIQLLLTAPGERVNRPDFGCGLRRRVFEGNTPALAATVRFDVTQSVQRWLGDVLTLVSVDVEAQSDVLAVTLVYRLLGEDALRTTRVST
jgi:phage baseplate assembly protein W